jgi:hypothetical protein
MSEKVHVALTWLLRERASGDIAAYMSLIADAVRLSVAEKELHSLSYPFKTIPALKIAKLAVSETAQQRYRGIGSFLVYAANRLARLCNDHYCVARFLTGVLRSKTPDNTCVEFAIGKLRDKKPQAFCPPFTTRTALPRTPHCSTQSARLSA